MYYYKLNMDNGYCGCDETYLLKTEIELTDEDFSAYIDGYYSYSDGFGGFDNDWESNWETYDDFWDDYIESILENSCYIEIDEAEFEYWVDEGYRVIEDC